jgi:3-oxoacyl-[acyl-carrier-protein] synthase II
MWGGVSEPRRVVITGIGCVTPIGIGRKAYWNGLRNGESGVREIETFDVSFSPVKIAAQVRGFDWKAQLKPKDHKHVPRARGRATGDRLQGIDYCELLISAN